MCGYASTFSAWFLPDSIGLTPGARCPWHWPACATLRWYRCRERHGYEVLIATGVAPVIAGNIDECGRQMAAGLVDVTVMEYPIGMYFIKVRAALSDHYR